MKRTGPNNEHLKKLIHELKSLYYKEKVRLWKRIAEDLEKPSRQRRVINLSKISLYADGKEQIIVPGKVLATGTIEQPITIAAYQFSKSAIEKLNESKSTFMSIKDIMEKNPKAKNLRIMG